MGIANPSITLDIISYTRHGQKETAYFNNLLLDNIELPIDITLVNTPKEVTTPSLLNNNQAALKHLKFQILTEIKNDLDKNNTNIKKIEIQVLGTAVTTLLESLDNTSKPFRAKCTS